MRKQRAIKRFFLTLMWLGVAVGMVTVVTAAIRVQEAGVCKGYNIEIEGFKEDMLFTSKENIVTLLKTAMKGDIKGQRKSDFNLPLIEDLLEQSSWVYNADLYFDNKDILHANVTERKPLARVFTDRGESFYIDEAGKHIPLSEKISLDLPVFTGFPSKKVMSGADSSLVQNVIATASFINSDPFWSAQVAQLDINNCGKDCWNMEMVPVVGNHTVDLGDGSDIASKFHRLYLFYDQVLKRTGFDKYQKIDVQYSGQVIGVKGKYTKVDSIQLRKNIENLLQQSRQYNEMVQVAPSLNYEAALLADTSAEAQVIYQGSEMLEDSILFLENNEQVDEKKEGAIAAAAIAKSTQAKEVKPTAKSSAENSNDKAKSEKKPVVVKKTETKNEVSKTSTKKTDTKKKETVKSTSKKDVKKTVSKKEEPSKKTKTATNSKAAVKKR